MTASKYCKIFKKGDIIFKEGDDGDCAYLIDGGRVEIVKEKNGIKTPIAILGPGEIFGEMGVIEGERRLASARALENLELSIVSKEQLNERINDSDPIVRLLITMLLHRIRNTLGADTSEITSERTNIFNIQSFKQKHLEDTTSIKSEGEIIEKIRVENELKQALDSNEFFLHFQPVMNLEKNRIAGLEALVRWDSPSRGLVRPDIFMGIAEETSLIVPLGQWILKKACEEYQRLSPYLENNSFVDPDFFVSINVSGRQMSDPKFFDVLRKATWANKLKAERIKLEITERVLVNGNYVFNWINKVREYGYSIALDDFGTGYSSLSYLSKLNVNNIKIDKSFVSAMKDDHSTYVIVKSIVQMAKGLNQSVIAEGIETRDELELVQKIGCKYGQGYLFSKPVIMDKVIDIITKKGKKKVA